MGKTQSKRDYTVADVAREAGVSKAQAARALGEYGAVSDAVRSRVAAAAERLAYRPNQLARSMNTGRSLSVGVVVGDIENPFFAVATRGISDAVEEHGFTVVLSNTSERLQAERVAVEMLMDKRVDGLIVAPAGATPTAHLEAVVQAGRPLVLLDRTVPGLDVEASVADVSQAAVEAGEELLALGHRRIGYITTSRHDDHPTGVEQLCFPVAARLTGLARAFELHGSEWDRGLLRDGLSSDDAIAAATRDLVRQDKVTALVASDSLIGQVVIGALQEEGLKIPSDVSVLMYDDQPWARLVQPPITVIAQPTYDIGHAAGTRLAALIKGTSALRPLTPFPAKLIRRASFGPARSEVPLDQHRPGPAARWR